MSLGQKRLLSAGVTLVGLLVLEAVARFVLPAPILPFVPSANPRLIYELNRSYPAINSSGMRQPEIEMASLHDRFVIAVIGDSHAYQDNSVTGADSFPARLEHHLDAQSGRKSTVLNFGVPGYNMVQELEVLRARALQFRPDLIILQYCVNDDHVSNYIQPKYPKLNRALHASVLLAAAWKTFLYSELGRSHVLPYVEEHAPDLLLFAPGLVGAALSREQDPAHGSTHPARSKDLVPVRYHDFIGRDNLAQAVHTFGDVCLRAGIPTLATGFIEDVDKGLYEAAGFRVYSFFDIFHGRDMRAYGYDPKRTDGHFSDRGNDVIGNALADYIRMELSLRSHGQTPDSHALRQAAQRW